MTDAERKARRRRTSERFRATHREQRRAESKAYRLARKRPLPPLPTSKVCAQCQADQPLSAFFKVSHPTGERSHRGGLGVDRICKACRSHLRNPTLRDARAEAERLKTAGLKICNVCRKTKLYEAFPTRLASPDKCNSTCRDCAKARSVRWRRENPGARNALVMRHYAAKLHATPAWADRAAIKAFYLEAARLTCETGIPHEVDHILPLQSDWVCGLHVATNLQILTKVENIKKRNKRLVP